MNTCDTCKWWKVEDNYVQHKCVNPSVTGRSARNSDENVMFLRSDAKEWEGLYTGPHFGCIHHSPKDEV